MDPQDVIDYGLLRYADPAKIDLGSYDSERVGCIFSNGLILLSRRCPPDEQVRILLHEIIHMHPQFMSYTGGLWEGSIVRDEGIESKIEALAQRTFLERQDIVSILRDRLNEAAKHPLNCA